MDNKLIKEEVMQDEDNYVAVYQDICLSVLDYIESQETLEARKDLKEFFAPPGIFDGLVNLLVQQIAKSPIRPHICDSKSRRILIHELVTRFTDLSIEKNLKVHDFKEFMEHIGVVKLLAVAPSQRIWVFQGLHLQVSRIKSYFHAF